MVKTKFKCNGCGEDRPCFLETNQEKSPFDYQKVEELKCVLDDTNQTSYNWTVVDIEEVSGLNR